MLVLQLKPIRGERYVYWKTPQGGLLSLGKLSEVLGLVNLRTRARSRDKGAILDTLEILGRTNLIRFLQLSPSLLDAELVTLNLA